MRVRDQEHSSGARANAYVMAARAIRDFGDGMIAILLPVHLLALGYSTVEVGVIASAALLGSSLLTIFIGTFGARHDFRRLLLAAAGLMVATGIAFAAIDDFALLIVVALVGTANPSAGNISIFVPLEHTLLARETAPAERTHIFARYSLVGALAAAAGALAAAAPHYLVLTGLNEDAALRVMFVLYAGLGVAGGLLYARLPRSPPALQDSPDTALGPSKAIVYKLAALFSLDAFSSGFVVQSLMALWLFQRFSVSLTTVGLFFFWANLASALSFPVAARLARHIGLVNTMVFTHIPASLCLIAAAFAPTLTLALTLLLARAFLAQMDVPARSSYVMAVVSAAERPAAASFTTVPRGLASAIAPTITGTMLAQSGHIWPFLISGVLKISYDLILLFMFRRVKPPEED